MDSVECDVSDRAHVAVVLVSWLETLQCYHRKKDNDMRMEHRVRSRSAGRPISVQPGMVTEASEASWPVGRNTSLDINSAHISRLKSLTGIGQFYANKIVNGRPYRHRDELLTREILPEYIYGRIRDRLVAGQA